MSLPQPAKPAKLIVGLFTADRDGARNVVEALCRRFGPIDMVSVWLAFDFTRYYEPEMGGPLFRRMLAFKPLMAQQDLARIKIVTNRIEAQHRVGDRRRVNLDPGYLTMERFVLATGKNFTHRIYIGEGIYADLTLMYTQGSFQVLPWTYPDYAEETMRCWLEKVRRKYVLDLKTVAGTSQ
jgi:hypothetical protein